MSEGTENTVRLDDADLRRWVLVDENGTQVEQLVTTRRVAVALANETGTTAWLADVWMRAVSRA